ncbi:NAD(P)H-quinone oxidoreductase [Chitinophaga nivalis]|uniref:NAD(P)H-quinone oxidoreductase n=1 Tax=Chitinophaga nivalis TaxID=2991709 RepID=A0ABT3ILY9_9BACT|nr:NAD(P)H-quinone oxidoreductase [Chitinophaga nivalis]MCW3465328.1 NAD(P)H-quinone oxidoreductase [Chitinophaga nivalis]MCW3484980.1 NAD(P)H-quinone oxidoreductase [Chitinophaga nivalis]
MKAAVITTYGDPAVLQIAERPRPQPGEQEVLIRVKAAGVNRPDVFQRMGKYPPPPGVPEDIPGLEVAGVIEACGAQVTEWKIGDAVCALIAGGGYAEYVTVAAGQCLPVPAGFSFVAAASLPETIFTVWSNVFQRGQLKAGEHFLVHGGSSGIGITAIQLAKAWGAKVFATAGTEEKCRECRELGAEVCINYKSQDFEQELQAAGVDVILDMIGGDYFEKNIRILRPEGRLVFINAMMGNTVPLNVMQLMQKRITITGSTLRSRDTAFKSALAADIRKQVWPLLTSGNFNPVVYQTFPLEAAAAAHALMESSQHTGKIILEIQ